MLAPRYILGVFFSLLVMVPITWLPYANAQQMISENGIRVSNASRLIASPKGTTFACNGGPKSEHLIFIDPLSPKVQRTISGENPILDLAYSPDGKFILVADGDVRLVSIATGDDKTKLGLKKAEAVAISGDGRYVATGINEETPLVLVWDLSTMKEVQRFKGHQGKITAVGFDPYQPRGYSKVFSAGTDELVRAWDIQTGKEVGKYKGVGAAINSLAFSADGNLLGASGGDKTIVWDLKEEEAPRSLSGGESATFSPDSKYLVTSSYVPKLTSPQEIYIWNIKTGKKLAHGITNNPKGVAISSDGRFLAAADFGGGVLSGAVVVWDFAKAIKNSEAAK